MAPNPPPTIHVLIDLKYERWHWEVIDTLLSLAGGVCDTYDEACDRATEDIRESIDGRAVVAYHHTFKALVRVGDPRPVSWVVSGG